MILIALISYFVLNKTVLGRYIYAVGGNPEASAISGISVKKITLVSYIMSGLTAAIGGIVLASMTQQGMASTAQAMIQRSSLQPLSVASVWWAERELSRAPS